ncbi:hypothetical protein TNCV_3719211 [Trichonephila clavipes]|nr:hypothetical protein TNCV_3719211 [Trichonephila clavipes]
MNETTQQEKTTQLSSRNEQLNSTAGTKQLNSSVGTKQLNSSVGTKQLNSALPSTAYNRLQPPTTACNRLQQPATAYNRLQPPTTACTAFTAESAFSTYYRHRKCDETEIGTGSSQITVVCAMNQVVLTEYNGDQMTREMGFVNGILETGGVMDKCVQMWTRNYGALAQTARVGFGVLCANRKKEEVKRDFGDLRIRRSEGRVVNTPLVFKRVLFQETRGDPEKKKKEEVTRKERTSKRGEKSSEKRRADRLRKRRGESQSFAR